MDLAELQQIEFELLKKFAVFCDTHGLNYCLAGGTLLGAVRHHDFIPWDDDVDVLMPRLDYERFIILASEGIGEYTALYAKTTIPNTPFPFAKIFDTRTKLIEKSRIKIENGVYIDVFPQDGLHCNSKEIMKHLQRIKFYKVCLSLSTMKVMKGRSWFEMGLKCVILPFFRIFDYRSFVKKIDNLAKKYEYDSSDRVALLVLGNATREITDRDPFCQVVKLPFRNVEFNVPSNCDNYLRSIFDDYMQLPPIDKRMTGHFFTAWWLE